MRTLRPRQTHNGQPGRSCHGEGHVRQDLIRLWPASFPSIALSHLPHADLRVRPAPEHRPLQAAGPLVVPSRSRREDPLPQPPGMPRGRSFPFRLRDEDPSHRPGRGDHATSATRRAFPVADSTTRPSTPGVRRPGPPSGAGAPDYQCELGISADGAVEPFPSQEPDVCAQNRWMPMPCRWAGPEYGLTSGRGSSAHCSGHCSTAYAKPVFV